MKLKKISLFFVLLFCLSNLLFSQEALEFEHTRVSFQQAKVATDFLSRKKHLIRYIHCNEMYDSIECLLVTKVWYEPSNRPGQTPNYYVVKVKGYETNGGEVVRIINFAETYYRDGNNAICVGKALQFDMDFCGNNSFSWDDAYFYTPGIFRGLIYPPTPNCTFVIKNNHLITFDIYINGSFMGTIKGKSTKKLYAVGDTPTTIKVVQKNYLLVPTTYKYTINQTKWGDVYNWTIPLL